MTVSGQAFVDALSRHRFALFAGVPCSMIEDAIAALERHPDLPWIAATREDVAVGVAAGAWLAGARPAVLMQNSGLGTSLNALASLSLMYGFPALLVVTWRGHGGKDAPEHLLMGDISPRLLDLLGIPHRVPNADSLADDVAWAAAEMDRLMQPVALLLPPGVVETGAGHGAAHGAVASPTASGTRACGSVAGSDVSPAQSTRSSGELTPRLSRLAALAAARKAIGREPVVHANGYICRESFSLGDRPQNFYMIGSMGLASAIALGVALARQDTTPIVFDGDGNLLMNLGILPLVAALGPRRFVHLVFDNEVYGSTGNQAAVSREVRLDTLARAAGYRTGAAVTDTGDITDAVHAALHADGPHFVLVKTTTEQGAVGRIPYTPHELRDRFRAAVAGG